jgi:hypothetical protein
MEAILKNQKILADLYFEQRKRIKLEKNRAEKAKNKKANLIKLL